MIALVAVLGCALARAADTPEVFAQLGHSNTVHAIAFAPDGRTLVSASEDGTAKLWDVGAQRELRTLHGTVAVYAVAYSPDGASLATGNADGSIVIWDSSSGRALHTLKGHAAAVHALAFSGDGRLLASGSADHSIKLWDPASAAELRTLSGHHDAVLALAFAHDARVLASGSVDKSVKLWDIASGRETHTLSGHSDRVTALAFCGAGGTLVSASWDKSVKVWDSAQAREIRTLHGPASEVWAVACSGDGRTIAAGSYDHSVRLWDGASGRELHTLAADPKGVEAVAFSPDGRVLASAGGSRVVTLWNASTGACLKADEAGGCASVLAGAGAFLKAVAFSNRSGLMLAAGGADRSIRIWRAADGDPLRTFTAAHTPWVGAIVFTADNKHVISRGGDNAIRVWDLETGRQLRSVAAGNPYAGSSSVAVSPDGALFAAGSDNNTVRVWQVADGLLLHTLTGHQGSVESVAFSPDGQLLASADAHGVVKIWKLPAGTELHTLTGHSKWVDALAFSADGRLLASAGGDHRVRLWDVASGSAVHTIEGHTAPVTALAFAPKDAVLASSDESGIIRLSGVPGGQELRTLRGHSDEVESISFSRDGALLASASEDSTLRLWDAASGSERVRLVTFRDGSTLLITPQGYYDFTGDVAEENVNVRIGNHVQGISAYRERFYRPDLVQRALGGQKIPSALPTLATVKAAPEVTIVDAPASVSTEALELHVRIADRGGGIGEIRTYINGAAVADSGVRGLAVEGLQSSGPTRSLHLRLVPERNDIQVVAFNADGSVHSNPAQTTVTANLPPSKGQLHALLVGIQEFDNPQYNLRFSVADANAMAQIIRSKAAPLFDKVNIETLTSAKATTKASIENAFAHYRNIAPGDVFVFYVASHGLVTPDLDNPQYYLVTSNLRTLTEEAVKRDALGEVELGEMIASVPATRKLLLLDTCHAGAMGDAMLEHLTHIEQRANVKKLSGAVGSTVISATNSDQEANEGEDGHGLFTWVLLQGLNGNADVSKHGFIKNLDLAVYADNEVPKIAEKHFHASQNPDLHNAGQSFRIASTQ